MPWSLQEAQKRQRIHEQAANIDAAQNLTPHGG
jgi:hypothetical protein